MRVPREAEEAEAEEEEGGPEVEGPRLVSAWDLSEGVGEGVGEGRERGVGGGAKEGQECGKAGVRPKSCERGASSATEAESKGRRRSCPLSPPHLWAPRGPHRS